jgi:hypothetical protein
MVRHKCLLNCRVFSSEHILRRIFRRCHNPEVHVITQDGASLYALIHIGMGTEGHPIHCNASVNSTVGVSASDNSVLLTYPAAGGATVHTSSSLNGPWSPLPGFPSCNNPSVMQHINGTLFAMCDSNALWRSERLAGPWMQVRGAFVCLARGAFVCLA